ncbi:aldehyde dehydrogenase family protein [Rhodococcus wratislaviensis]|uniref:Putative aldehyde dehydrogenase n=1 Tax=Rhodococcus wratislaviensis NBRC 100605 TaxID=1219028 RepID=X0PWB1_RHOWR|nr:aldehyde dehydrogenase family protein [Rhodococcus wratislaviensis]GAF47639.1 putative aldehyde dehydrogenase [Rhodococcus wratislaviensis NBRC 100605]
MTVLEIVEPPTAPFLAGGATQQMFIGGARCDARSGETFTTLNPATGAVLATVAAGGREDVDRAVAAARAAFEEPRWSFMNPHERTRLMLRLADGIEERAEELATLESLDTGIPISNTRAMMAGAAQSFRYYAGWPTKLTGTVNPVDPMVHSYTVRSPIGVCAGIVPWNGPVVMASWKIAPALACGNTVILKPAEQTPLTALLLAEIFQEAGLPDGVLNVVTGLGESAGAAIAAHPSIDKVSFTGSTETGKKILAASLDNLKRVTLELGGKSPHIILADADIDLAARNAAAGFCALSGQVCVAGTRILIHEAVREEFSEKIAAEMAAYTVGDPFGEDTVLGPLISAEQRDRVNSYVELGRRDGLSIAVGGESITSPGYYVEPTLFENVSNDHRLAREEIFGPVAAVIPFRDVDEAVRIANDTPYGLGAAVATRDVSQAHRLAQRLQAGVVWVNTYGELDPTFPFGGFKQSGVGRELGEKSLDNFTELKSVVVRL